MESSDDLIVIMYGLAALIKESPDGYVSVSWEWFKDENLEELGRHSIEVEPRDNGNVYYTLKENT